MQLTVRKNGQIVIPLSVSRKLGVKKGTRIQIEKNEKTNQIILKPITREYIFSLCGKYKGKGLLEELMREKKFEKER